VIDLFRDEFLELNTWGDGIMAALQSPYQMALFALAMRDFYRNRIWKEDLLPKLKPRIALHAGYVHIGEDPIRKTKGIVGMQVILPARLEPQGVPGEIWASKQFFDLVPADQELPFAFEHLGEKDLAKGFGITQVYRLRREYEAAAEEAKSAPASTKSAETEKTPPAPAPVNAEPGSKEMAAIDVCHPQKEKKWRGQLHPCTFHICDPEYKRKGRWRGLGDVLVDVIGDLPDEDWCREAYMFPSARALPKLRDSQVLRKNEALLDKKKEAAQRFVAEWQNRDLQGYWFEHPVTNGRAIGAYCLAYDLFLNASLTTPAGKPQS
jgi:hypothetical protein